MIRFLVILVAFFSFIVMVKLWFTPLVECKLMKNCSIDIVICEDGLSRCVSVTFTNLFDFNE